MPSQPAITIGTVSEFDGVSRQRHFVRGILSFNVDVMKVILIIQRQWQGARFRTVTVCLHLQTCY